MELQRADNRTVSVPVGAGRPCKKSSQMVPMISFNWCYVHLYILEGFDLVQAC